MPDEDIELVYLTLDDALELYAAIVKGTTEGAAAVLRASSTLEGALARPAKPRPLSRRISASRPPSSRMASPRGNRSSTVTSASRS